MGRKGETGFRWENQAELPECLRTGGPLRWRLLPQPHGERRGTLPGVKGHGVEKKATVSLMFPPVMRDDDHRLQGELYENHDYRYLCYCLRHNL